MKEADAKVRRERLLSGKILVAGGAGFIGSNLCDRLVEEGFEVLCLDNLYTGSIENIRHLLPCPGFQFVHHDVLQPFRADRISAVINLACPASPVHYQKDALYTIKTAVIGTMHLLDLARMNDCPLLQASTSEVYGDPDIHPQCEEYNGNVNTLGVRSCYDEGKRCAESLCMNYFRQHASPRKSSGFSTPTGPAWPWGTDVSSRISLSRL